MDLLFKRYASPFLFLNQVIKSGRFSEFVSEILKFNNEEKEEEALWEYFLHKVFDKSFIDFKNECDNKKQPEQPVDFETTINESYSIIDGFVPE